MAKIKEPIVFTEWHHGGLFQAIVNLFEKRLGGLVFAPVGFEWVENHYWRYALRDETIKQYLDPASCLLGSDGFFYYYDPAELRTQRRITFKQFKEMKFDILLCTLTEHQDIYVELKEKYQKKAKLIRLSGNAFEMIDFYNYKNFIDTTALYHPPKDVNYILLHQEFPLRYFFYTPPKETKKIKVFINEFPSQPEKFLFDELKKRLREFQFFVHGSHGDDGFITGLDKLGEAIRDSSFIFHPKRLGEGYGHLIHNFYACGRPVITFKEYYRGKIAERLLIDGVTAIFMDGLSLDEIVNKIRYYSDPGRLFKMSLNAYQIFKKMVNFDREEKEFRNFMARLK
jgi:hypothetical protein